MSVTSVGRQPCFRLALVMCYSGCPCFFSSFAVEQHQLLAFEVCSHHLLVISTLRLLKKLQIGYVPTTTIPHALSRAHFSLRRCGVWNFSEVQCGKTLFFPGRGAQRCQRAGVCPRRSIHIVRRGWRLVHCAPRRSHGAGVRCAAGVWHVTTTLSLLVHSPGVALPFRTQYTQDIDTYETHSNHQTSAFGTTCTNGLVSQA